MGLENNEGIFYCEEVGICTCHEREDFFYYEILQFHTFRKSFVI